MDEVFKNSFAEMYLRPVALSAFTMLRYANTNEPLESPNTAIMKL